MDGDMPALNTLLTGVNALLLGNGATEITGITFDSRKVKPGDLYACVPGAKTHGQTFIPEALAAGAAALLVEDDEMAPPGTPALVTPNVRAALAWLAANFYGRPADVLTLVGVTGTNGKTTVTTLLRGILQAAGHPTGLVGTLAYHIGDTIEAALHTTPMAADLQALLARMRDAGLTHVVMEVSSHALCQHRVTGCRFQAAALTNVTQDHLDFHGTLEAYRDAKVSLFADPRYQPREGAMLGLLNADDPSAPDFAARALGPTRTFGTAPADYQAQDVLLRAEGSRFTLSYPGGTLPIALQLVGSFNVSNALAAAALALELGVAPATVAAALAAAPPVAGRFQRVAGSGGARPAVVVDYAHTPDGLEKVLATAQEIAPGRVSVVFGCGGDRDRGKRPQMAAIAARLARDIVVTSDNPRSEDPQAIIAEILTGIPAEARARVTVEPDRALAIRHAILAAAPGDLIVLAGKGHEDYQIFADRTVHFDDREEAAAALAAWGVSPLQR
jgi:UDP-N-acetylmuramoyl-L-alanyl-D-glutamate--2,6-diaminopimelate ligase